MIDELLLSMLSDTYIMHILNNNQNYIKYINTIIKIT